MLSNRCQNLRNIKTNPEKEGRNEEEVKEEEEGETERERESVRRSLSLSVSSCVVLTIKKSNLKVDCVHRSPQMKNPPSQKLRRAKVEVTGIEPVSKHDTQKLSTCLFQN